MRRTFDRDDRRPKDDEHRIAYVAATRRTGDPGIRMERNVDWAEHPYEYPPREQDGNRR